MNIEDGGIAIVGGCGHVGLPLGIKFALAEVKTTLIDVNKEAIDKVLSGKFPFEEKGGDEQLAEALDNSLLFATSDLAAVAHASVVVFVIGTPVDEHLNPKIREVISIFDIYRKYFQQGILVVMRSTLAPGTMEFLSRRLADEGIDVKLSFCPERVSQGHALDEIDSLPQIVSAFDEDSFIMAKELFAKISPEILRLSPMEAELAKLMANSWRYLEFAIANQFYMISEKNGVDFYKVFNAICYKYPRASGYKSPGFSAGPCLFKDTMQLASFFDHQFHLGHAAMLVNEGLADFVVDQLSEMLGGEIWGKNVLILGLAFKADNDDIRESLSFRVMKILEFAGVNVLCHDPWVANEKPLEELLLEVEGVIICTPHSCYKDLKIKKPCVDVWGFMEERELEIIPGNPKKRS